MTLQAFYVRLVVIGLMVLVVAGAIAGDLDATACGREPLPARFLVIAPARFQSAMTVFLEHKRQSRETSLVTLEEVLRTSQGADDAEKLKRYIFEASKAKALGYVLLVGDADVMPVRYMVLDRVTKPAYDYAFYPSDLYFSDLTKRDGSFEDWNARTDGFHGGYFGEVRGEANKQDPINFDAIDYLPEIAVGRWPVSTQEEVALLCAKSLTYEKGIRERDKPGERTAAFLSVDGWVDSRGTMDNAASRLDANWSIERRYYGSTGKKASMLPTEEALMALLNAGTGLVMHAGHGRDDCWEQCFPLSALDRLSNADRLPIVLSAGCSTARFATLPPYEAYVDTAGQAHVGTNAGESFDQPPPPPACYQTGTNNPTGLGEQLLRRNADGAIAYIGCNTGSQPCGLALLTGFAKSYDETPDATLGECWTGAIACYYEEQQLATLKPNSDWYPPSIFFQAMKFMCFGDPTLPLPTRE